MRPDRLEMEGFGTYRARTVVDFSGAELFALTGPTGAGKSTVLDAMVFALYGSVPRHGRKDVAPLVTQGGIQGRVLLEFEVGRDRYTVARVVRKDGRGRASTDEARLERDGEVIASGAREVDEAVAGVLGLDYEQFTTCVVLPQGEFERFLHAKPADRQDLLVALLDLGLYERIASLANGRQKYEEGRRAQLQAQLASLPEVSSADREAAARRAQDLEALLGRVDAVQPDLDRLAVRGREARERLDRARNHAGALAAVTLPDGFSELADRLAEAAGARAAAHAELEEARQALEKAQFELDGRSSGQIEDLLGRRRALGDLEARATALTSEVATAAEAEAAALDRHRQAADTLDRRRRHDMAQHLRTGLAPGDPCPVCTRPVDAAPSAGEDAGLVEAEAAVGAAAVDLDRARSEVTGLRGRLEELERQVEVLRRDVDGVPAVEVLEARLMETREAESQVAAARLRVDRAEADLRRAADDLEGLSGRERQARLQLQQARDGVAGLEPPALEMLDVTADWRRLVDWAGELAPALEAEATALAAECEQLRTEHDRLLGEVEAEAARLKVVPDDRRPLRDAVVDGLASATSELASLDARIATMADLGSEIEAVGERAVVARELAGHLRANNFERWILDEAMRVLAIGANGRLAELAQGQYSLALSDRLAFEVVDHHAADERRPVRSLSGGETFLVSLALALSLSDHIAGMATGGSARLESIFLDEGFGTLDPETLATVAGVISQIGSTGKTVGLVTHVKELAEQVPVRFEVTKDAGGSRVARVES